MVTGKDLGVYKADGRRVIRGKQTRYHELWKRKRNPVKSIEFVYSLDC